ncbi:MAG: hypothetical protein QOF32_1902 [Gammaproteobacteria bacterium]|jgi:hypothetical protein|nr:hypothetical protein [Gammaproteobacteria bacterium]
MKTWIVTALLAASLAGPSLAADTFDLFTESEAATWNAAQAKEPKDFSTRDLRQDNSAPTCHSLADNDADNPQIRILAPLLGRSLTVPVDIDVQFMPTSSAPIRPDTFRLCYIGLVTVDLTKRITDRIMVSEKGLHVAGAQLPRGRHRLLLLVADQRGRLGLREAVFNID